MQAVEQFAMGVVAICMIIMRGVGVIDDLFSQVMISLGVLDAHVQLYILLGILAFYVVLSLKAVGGMLGWAMLFFAVLLLMHRTIPSLSAPNMPVVGQITNAF
jgi:hypothetical protein